jgi:galactokinase
VSGFHDRLREAGLEASASVEKAQLLRKLTSSLSELHGADTGSTCAFFVPGRLEFLGKHTDYAGGRSLVCAIDRGICIVSAPRRDALVRIVDAALGSTLAFDVAPGIEPPAGHWSNYPMTVARRLARDFPEARTGADIVFASDLPSASGMSSGSALVVSVFLALAHANSLQQTIRYRQAIATDEELAGYLSAVENGGLFGAFEAHHGVGTMGGSEDHVAILCSRAERLRQYSYCPVRFEREVRLPEPYTFAFAFSGITADKAGSALEAYNRASSTARRLLDLWHNATGRSDPSLAAALSSDTGAIEQLRTIVCAASDQQYSTRQLIDRLEHFAAESNEIVPAAAAALARGDFELLGAIVDRSQSRAEVLLGNQTPETLHLARAARSLGAAAASAFGAGFGGSVWALIESDRADAFMEEWADDYRRRFPDRSEASRFFASRPGPGVVQL